MAVDLDWSLLTNASQNFGNALTGAASQIRQHRQTATDEGNLSNYLQQPDNPKAFNAVAAHNPQLAYQIQDHHLEAARNLRADHAQQLDTIGQILTGPNGQPITADQYPQALELARQAGVDVTGHETFDPAFVNGVVQLHQRLHPVAPIDAAPGHQLLDPQTGAARGPGVPREDSVVPMTGGGFVVAHHNNDGTISITDQNGVVHLTQPTSSAPASSAPPPLNTLPRANSPADIAHLPPGAWFIAPDNLPHQVPMQGGAPPPNAAGTFPRQDGGAFDSRAHPPGG